MKDWLRRVSVEFVKYQKSKKRRSRYQYDFDSGDWQYIQTLHSSRGLASVALDKRDEDALMADLNTFLADKEFYKRMGLPWKRGYMFTGRPGTGKTSLINAISAHYNRDIYFMNLKEYDSDKQLQNAFSRVPKNCMIVFEDVDAHNDDEDEDSDDSDDDSDDDATAIPPPPPPSENGPSLATLLNCLDGHSLAEGVMIVMTTNHPEVLDPAVIRPGRIDLHLDLGYCT
ncbi:P-loop containing nucleoside triphosphate hydrolase protein, partial [Zopfochytrium polystomum]